MTNQNTSRDATGKSEEKKFRLLAAIVVSVISVATAWGGYQSALWLGQRTIRSAEANAAHAEAVHTSLVKGQQTELDAQLFVQWLGAVSDQDDELATFYRQRMRPEALLALEAWLELDPFDNPDAPPSPFAMPEYTLAQGSEAEKLRTEAKSLFESAMAASSLSDQYVLATVILASALALGSLATRFDQTKVRVILIALALMVFAYGLYRLVVLPVR